MRIRIKIRKSALNKLKISLTRGQLKVTAGALTGLASGWIGSLVIFPGLFEINSLWDFILLLTYSLSFAIVSILSAAKIEDYLYEK